MSNKQKFMIECANCGLIDEMTENQARLLQILIKHNLEGSMVYQCGQCHEETRVTFTPTELAKYFDKDQK